ncbi:hypothetical protein [Citrobacter phage Tr1]|nr:hypothetical protein [Citrobacter phage Tr1]
MRNYVAKHDFNRASVHRDRKHDYSRNWDLEQEMYDDTDDLGGDSCECSTNGSEEDCQ